MPMKIDVVTEKWRRRRLSGGSITTMDSSGETEEDSAPEACVSPEGSLLPSNSREMRNKAEKQRRDRLNGFIGELATLVPMVAKSAKRLDKTSILRLTATHLRIYQTLGNGKKVPQMEMPKKLNQNILEQLVCDELGGFLLIITPNGKIIFISHTVESLLGHLQTDLMGQSLFNITASEDHDRLRMYLQCEGAMEQEWRKYFSIRLKKAGPRSETAVYESVRMMGVHRPFQNGGMSSNASSPSTSSASSTSFTPNVNEMLLFFVKVCRPEPLANRLLEASKDEYVTRHLIDGRIINADQRISLIAGYMTEEVHGNSAFLYMHRDDVRWVMIALRQMYDRGESKGGSCYRLKSRNGQFIYLRTFGFLEIDDQGTVESFICVNTLVPEQEGLQLIGEMKRKFSALIASDFIENALTVSGSEADSGGDLVEDPLQVQEAVTQLMRNLPSPGSEHSSTLSPQEKCQESQDCQTQYEAGDGDTAHTSKPYHIKVKSAMKRPASVESEGESSYKRLKIAPPQLSPVQRILPYPNAPPGSGNLQETSNYQHDQMLRQNI